MENKLSQFEQMMQELKSLSGNNPRETALDDQGLGYIGRPVEQIDEQVPSPPIEPSSESEANPYQDIIDGTNKSTSDYFKRVGEGSLPMPGIGLGINNDLTDIEGYNQAKDLNTPIVDAPPEILKNQEDAFKPKEETAQEKQQKLIDEYRKLTQEQVNSINEAADRDRSSMTTQGILGGLGKALTYSSSAGGRFMSSPIPLDFKVRNPGYADQAKDTASVTLKTAKDVMDEISKNARSGNKSSTMTLGDKSYLITYGPDGEIIKQTELGDAAFAGLKKTQAENKNQNDKAKLSLDTAKLENKKFENSKLDKKELETLTEVTTTLDSLDKVDKMKTFSTGPLQGRIEAAKRYIGASPGNKVAMAAQIESILSKYGNSISGTAINEGEMQRLRLQLPNMNDSDDAFAEKLANAKNEFENSRTRLLDYFDKGGKNIDKFINRVPIEEVKKELQSRVSPTPSASPNPVSPEKIGSDDAASQARQKRIAELKAKQGSK